MEVGKEKKIKGMGRKRGEGRGGRKINERKKERKSK